MCLRVLERIYVPYEPLRLVVSGQALVVRLHHITPLVLRNDGRVVIKEVGKQEVRPLLVEPQQLLPPQREDASEDQSEAAVGVRLRVGERQRRAPRSPKDDPLVDAEVLPQLLDVLDEVPGRVLLERGVRGRLPRAPLVEQDAAVVGGIKVLSVFTLNRDDLWHRGSDAHLSDSSNPAPGPPWR